MKSLRCIFGCLKRRGTISGSTFVTILLDRNKCRKNEFLFEYLADDLLYKCKLAQQIIVRRRLGTFFLRASLGSLLSSQSCCLVVVLASLEGVNITRPFVGDACRRLR